MRVCVCVRACVYPVDCDKRTVWANRRARGGGGYRGGGKRGERGERRWEMQRDDGRGGGEGERGREEGERERGGGGMRHM